MALNVGFVGLGNMGEGMASNVAKAGFPLVVRDIRPEPVQRLVALGASVAASNYELATRSSVVCVALFDEAQVRSAFLPDGDDRGLLAGLARGSVVAIHSTVPPRLTRQLAESAAEHGVAILDVPMTGGGDTAARAGKLTFFVGGDEAAFNRAQPALQAMSQHLFYVGGVGAGSTTKILSNFMAISNVLLVREALRLARAAGIDEEQWLSVINAGGVGSSWVSNNWARIREQEDHYTTGRSGMVAMSNKDMHLAQDLAREFGTPTPTLDHLIENALPELGNHGLTR
ncbi:NAD(P)-dependent oxidoreductase [Paraburkholderia sp. GAS32]|uniref:NAD(P)-dependent oxidoreductase n=1 Tax=Paraburkholderia sp. GAS32 TaxID=3035129 RepID=UPI003D22BE01